MEFVNVSADDNATTGSSDVVRATRVGTLCVIASLTIFGNILVIAAVGRYRKLQNSANVFVTNLALSNLISGVMMMFMSGNVLVDRNVLSSGGCTAWGFVMGTALICSTYTMALVALNRYVLIAHAQNYRVVFSRRNCALMCALAWGIAFLILLGTVTGWSEIKYNPRTKACSYSRDANITYHYVAIIMSFAVPLLVIVCCYSLLYHVVRTSKRRVLATQGDDNNKKAGKVGDDNRQGAENTRAEKIAPRAGGDKRVQSAEGRLTSMLITIFLVYALCLGPYCLVGLLDSQGSRFPEIAHVFVTWLLFSNAAANPTIYGLMNKNFRNGYLYLLVSRCPCCGRLLRETRRELEETMTNSIKSVI